MKKILTGFLFFIVIVFIQALYIDYRLSDQLNKIGNNQLILSQKVEILEMQTDVVTIKLEDTPLKLRKKAPHPLPALVSSDTSFQSGYVGDFLLAGND
ncbi:MAG: hypothetical protein D8M58_21955 [Calditrichaeota bacterium]|nr:MAG: hypothetical protein DWQ03_11070 [Calditrichota bacterium]MBL1208077.1 hypothetical protein [Calditrichota bacterium]NOG47915.1 hypothetical protein [Calditrichota bacterium]